MTWEDRLKQLITPETNNYPYRIVQIKPNRQNDEEIYTLSGREEDIAANGSLFLALYDLNQRNRINFDEWFEQWSLGFPDLNLNRENSNYQLLGQKRWRKTEERPRFKDWTPPELRQKLGYRTIEVWLNRNIETESTVFSGTDMQLINHCIQLEYEGGGSANIKSKGGNLPYLKGQPLITLEFIQDPDKVGVSFDGNLIPQVTGTITFRIMDKTDDPKSDLEKISKTDLQNYAKRISEEFGANGGYVWEKGKAVLSYRSRKQGFEGWYLVKHKTSGITLVEKLLAITGKKIETTCIKFSETENASAAYPETSSKTIILGEEIELARERPVVDVRFREASIHLPRSRKTIQLVLFANVVYK
jgi:hypothetical protein